MGRQSRAAALAAALLAAAALCGFGMLLGGWPPRRRPSSLLVSQSRFGRREGALAQLTSDRVHDAAGCHCGPGARSADGRAREWAGFDEQLRETPLGQPLAPALSAVSAHAKRCGCPLPIWPMGQFASTTVPNSLDDGQPNDAANTADSNAPKPALARPGTQKLQTPADTDLDTDADTGTYVEALPPAPAGEEPQLEPVTARAPDLFSPQESWTSQKGSRTTWYYDYEAAPYTAQFDDTADPDAFAPDEPWNSRQASIILDGTLADLKRACLGAGRNHHWDTTLHECLVKVAPYADANGRLYPEQPRGLGVTQEGPSRQAIDGSRPLGDTFDDAKEVDPFGARRLEPAGEVDQFGWRPAAAVLCAILCLTTRQQMWSAHAVPRCGSPAGWVRQRKNAASGIPGTPRAASACLRGCRPVTRRLGTRGGGVRCTGWRTGSMRM